MHSKKQHLQNVEFFENDKRQKESQTTKRSRTPLDSKVVMMMRENHMKQKELQTSHEGKAVVPDEDVENEQVSERWSHLWVPNYKPNSAYFSHWDSVKEITQEETEGWL